MILNRTTSQMAFKPFPNQARWSGWICCLLACVALGLPPASFGRQTPEPANPYPDQSVVSNTPAYSSTQPPAVGSSTPGTGVLGNPLLGTSALGGYGAPPAATIPGVPGPLHYGPLNVYPQARYLFTYGNSLQATPGQRSDTVVNIVSPGILMTWKTNWSLQFTPSLYFYSNPAFRDVTDYAVSLNGSTTYQDWTFKVAQGYSQTDTPLIETGAQTGLTAYITALEGIRQMGSHFSLELGVNQTFRDAQGLSDLHEWTTSDWINYQAGSMFGSGLGVILGYDQLNVSSDMPFEQLQGRISFASGRKVSLVLSGGVEDRQFLDPSAPPLISPIFSAQGLYQPFESSTLSVQAARTVVPSFFSNEINTHTVATAGWRQRLLNRLYFDVTGSYSTEPYTSIEPGPLPPHYLGKPPTSTLQVVRNDTTTTVGFSLSCTFHQHLTANAYYDLNQAHSSQSAFSASTSQIGFSLEYAY
jgi:hypothetical protein